MAEYTPKQLNDLGEAYFTGVGKTQNKEMAYTYFKQAADLDNPVGHHNIGRYFLDKGDYKSALDAFTKAKSYRFIPSYLAIASMYKEGTGLKKNKKRAFKIYEEAAQNQDVDSYLALASCYETGYGTKKSIEKAKVYYQKAVDLNHPFAMYKLATFYEQDLKDKTKQDQAFELYEKASQQGEVHSLKRLIALYDKGAIPLLKKKSQHYRQEMVFYYTELLAKQADMDALITVANRYFEGSHVTPKNYEKAYQYYSMLAERNHEIGYFGLGCLYLYGFGVKPNLERSKECFERAQLKGHILATTRLGDYYRLTAKQTSDYEMAKDWYLKAAKSNEPEALINLGLLHYRHQIDQSNPTLALQYFETALKKGALSAHYWLGVLYQKGDGVTKNIELAKKHFEKAIQAGNLGAKYKLATMLLEWSAQPKLKAKAKLSMLQSMHEYFLAYAIDPQSNPANQMAAMTELARNFEQGRGTAQNPRAARYWYEFASMKGEWNAMIWMYQTLKTKESSVAWDWLKKAAEKEDAPEAYYQMGLVYQHGFLPHVSVDLKQAKRWYEQAAKKQHPQAIATLLIL